MSNVVDLSPGQSLGRYELLAQVARGGRGEVWAARLKGARGFQKIVAIRTFSREFRGEVHIEQTLLEEARITSLIHHPNIVQTTELGEHDDYLYLVTEWVEGESLSFLMKRAEERGWVPVSIGVNLIAQACRGLHAAHELTSDLGVHLGVVHRDVSPHNVLVTLSGVVRLVGFGIAKATNEQGSLTADGELKGKYSFMAPEQVMSGDVDRRADVFALGITLYMLVTGQHPFCTNTKQSVLAAITDPDPATPPRTVTPSCSPALEAVVLKALEKDPDARFQSTEAMRVALENAVPDAFKPRFESEVREYLAKVMGDRAAARREALRRFQLSVDERALWRVDPEAPALTHASQSSGSLGALMVEASPEVALALDGVDLASLAESPVSGLTPALAASLGEAASFCLSLTRGYQTCAHIDVLGWRPLVLPVRWHAATDQVRRAHADRAEATERGATAIAILLIHKLAGLAVLERSCKGTGFDYWIGGEDRLFQGKERLEVSGILHGDERTVRKRMRDKEMQTERSDSTLMPAHIVVVEFSRPMAHCKRRPAYD